MAIDPKEHAHALIERLGPVQVAAVANLLETMPDPVTRAIANAPLEEEPLSEKGENALDEARDWLQHNQPISHERVLSDLGITPQELDNFKGNS